MKVFVTLGTTPFDSFIDEIHNQNLAQKFELVIQHIKPISSLSRSFTFVEDIKKWYEWADIIICHAGAGTVFELLENSHKFLCIANTDRLDNHQLELIKYVELNNLASSIKETGQLERQIIDAYNRHYAKYQHEPFSGGALIADII